MNFDLFVGNRIAELLQSNGMKQSDLVATGCVKKAHISRIIKGEVGVSLETLASICDALAVSLSDFFQPIPLDIPPYLQKLIIQCRDLSLDEVNLLSDTVKHIKILRHAVSSYDESEPESMVIEESENDDVWKDILGDAAAGYEGVYRPADDGDRIRVPKRYASNDYYVIRAYGKSMEPRIHNGGCVVVHRNMPPSNGDLALIRKHGVADHELMIKKYFKEDEIIRLVSANPEFDDIRLEPECIALCERVVYIVRDKNHSRKAQTATEE